MVISKAVEDNFERKLREVFPENFRAARNKVKQQSKTLVIALRNRRHKKWLNIRRKESEFQSSRDSMREFKKQIKCTSFKNVTCFRERRKKTKEKMLNALTNRKKTPPPETAMTDLTPCEENEKSNISSDTNYSNSNTILSEMSEIQPIIEIESYANVLRLSVETAKKARMFTKDNQQNVLDDSSLDFTKNISNGNNNTYDQVPGTSGNINFSDLFKALKKDDNKVLCRAETLVESPSTAGKINTSGNDTSLHILDSGDEELVNILQSFETIKTPKKAAKVINERLEGYFCSKSVFNLSKKVLTETEIRVLEKGLGFAPTPTKINETDLRADFNEFARKMRCKWFFRNEPTENFSEAPAFRVKSNWNPPKGHPAVEIFLSKLETEIFSVLPGTPLDYNLSKEEWLAMRGLAEDRNIIIKPADKGSCVVVWDREDYIAEADKQLQG